MTTKTKRRKKSELLLITGCANNVSRWNGTYWENCVGQYVDEINKEIKRQGYRIVKIGVSK